LRQAGANENDRQLALGAPVDRHDESAHFLFGEVLHLVHDHSDGRTPITSSFPYCVEQFGQVGFELPGVSCASFRLNIYAIFTVREFHGADETSQDAKTLLYLVAYACRRIKAKEYLAKRGHEDLG